MGTKNNPGKYDCYSRAEPDEPVFVLLGRDPIASLTVTLWRAIRIELNESDEKIAEARDCALAMEEWARSKGKDVEAAFEAFKRALMKIDGERERVRELEALCGRAADVIAEQVSINVADGGLRGRQELDDLVRELRGA